MYYSLKAQKRKWTPEGVIDIVNKLIFNLLSSRDLKNTVSFDWIDSCVVFS